MTDFEVADERFAAARKHSEQALEHVAIALDRIGEGMEALDAVQGAPADLKTLVQQSMRGIRVKLKRVHDTLAWLHDEDDDDVA